MTTWWSSIKARKWVRDLQNMEALFGVGSQGHECVIQPIFVVRLSYSMQPCCCRFIVHGGSFMKMLKTYKVKKPLHLLKCWWSYWSSVLLLLLCRIWPSKKTRESYGAGNAAVVKVVESQLNCMSSIIPMTKPLYQSWLLRNITNDKQAELTVLICWRSGEIPCGCRHYTNCGDPSDLDDRQFYLSGLIGIDQDELSAGGRKSIFAKSLNIFYQESQKIALERIDVEATARKIQTPYQTVRIPDSVILQDPKTIRLDRRWQFIPWPRSLSDTERSGDLSTAAWKWEN